MKIMFTINDIFHRRRLTPSDNTRPASDFALLDELDFDKILPAVFKSFLLGGFSDVVFLVINLKPF